MTSPNLFDYATSELSQDAFLCWVIANAGQNDRSDLRDLGRAFIAWLWSIARAERVLPDAVRLVKGPQRQVRHVDILFEAEVGGRLATFLIEDKTETSQHSGQLQRYKAALQGDGRDLVPVYFKTGYHFGVDTSAAEHGYAVVGLREWLGFLAEHTVPNDILTDYRACMDKLLRTREKNLASLLTANGHGLLGIDYVQYEFVRLLAARCTDAVGSTAINRGVNVGGAPWTHYRFARFAGVLPGGLDEALFHRVDARNDEKGKRRYYLSTRQYAVVKRRPDARTAKVARLRNHVEAFRRAVEASGTGLRFSRPSGDNQGANESEIGIVFFDEGMNSLPAVLEGFAAAHAGFVQTLKEGDGSP